MLILTTNPMHLQETLACCRLDQFFFKINLPERNDNLHYFITEQDIMHYVHFTVYVLRSTAYLLFFFIGTCV